jgi:hypothetical protein
MNNALKLRPNNVNYLLAIWTLYDDLWDKQNSRKYYFKVLEIEPTNELAKQKVTNI